MFNLKKKILLLLVVILLLGALWQKGFINLPPKLTYTFSFLRYKLSESGRVAGNTTVKFNVPFHKQEHSLSCEVAALKMALSAIGVEVSESELIQNLVFDQTPKKSGIWGDPDQGFVGLIDGRMPQTGYGVYAGPIAQLASSWRPATVLDIKTPEALAAHLLQGRPIVIWGYYGRGQKLSWATPEGKTVKAVNGEHTRTVIGFTGNASEPEGFYLIDPLFGPMYWTTNKLVKNWDALDRMAVVVYPKE